MDDLISRQAAIDALNEIINKFEQILRDIRATKVDESVCGLCEYDGAYIGQSGNWCNECPGFDKDDCFKLSDEYRKRWLESVDLSSVEVVPVKHGRWIPVSERLPEEDGYYLTYGDWPDGYLILAFKHIRNWKKGHFFIAPFWNSPSEIVDRAVIAWMPLPEPYKEGEPHEQN